jgi:hypothetical protein
VYNHPRLNRAYFHITMVTALTSWYSHVSIITGEKQNKMLQVLFLHDNTPSAPCGAVMLKKGVTDNVEARTVFG